MERLPKLISPDGHDFRVYFNTQEDLDKFVEKSPHALTWEEVINSKREEFKDEFYAKCAKINELSYAIILVEDSGEGVFVEPAYSVLIREYPDKLVP